MDNVRPEIEALAKRGNITWAEYKNLRLNSYEQEVLYPAMTDHCLVTLIERRILPYCSYRRRRPAVTYDDSLRMNFVPLLIERVKRWLGDSIITAETHGGDLRDANGKLIDSCIRDFPAPLVSTPLEKQHA